MVLNIFKSENCSYTADLPVQVLCFRGERVHGFESRYFWSDEFETK